MCGAAWNQKTYLRHFACESRTRLQETACSVPLTPQKSRHSVLLNQDENDEGDLRDVCRVLKAPFAFRMIGPLHSLQVLAVWPRIVLSAVEDHPP